MLSKSCTYGLQAMIYLAALKDAQTKEKQEAERRQNEGEQGETASTDGAEANLSQSIQRISNITKRITYKGDEFVAVQLIAENLNISFHFLKKILQELADAELLLTSRGAGGGIKFARPSHTISLYDIVAAIDGERIFKGCLLYLRGCGHETPCPLHDKWTGERERLSQYYKGVSLLEAGRNFTEYKLRLAFDAMMQSS